METLVREKGVNSFQMFMTYKDLYMLRDSELYQVLRACRDIGAIARVHAENGELVAEGAKEALDLGITGPEGIEISRPEELEAEATHRVITIANRTHCPVYLVNVSSMSAGDVVAAAKMQGKVVYAETTTAHATLTGLHYYHQDWFHAAAYVTVPPLRLDTNTSAYLMSLLAKHPLLGPAPGTPCPQHLNSWAWVSLGASIPGHPVPWAPQFLGAELPGHPTSWVTRSPGTPLCG
ncbi:DPYL5 protein, partial [Ciccaba nigrolineata]|nr:DPYL5 protein [Ciccaba nigrolineata]